MKKFLKYNFIPLAFALCFILVELTAVYVTSGRVYIRSPWVFLSTLTALTALQYLMPTNRARHIYSTVTLCVLFVMNLVFIVIYEMTGTIFDFSMLQLRNDAMAILESIPINFVYTAVSGILISSFIVFGNAFDDGTPVKTAKLGMRLAAACMVVALACQTALVYGVVAKNQGDLRNKLYGDAEDGYAEMGITGNLLVELSTGVFGEVEIGDLSEIREFIYRDTSDPTSAGFGAAEGYNVVTILAESLEWFAFVQDENLFPYGHTANQSVLRKLYPNLYRFCDSSYVLSNFHGREKTDISENLSLLGNYPTNYYVNYDYPNNTLPYSLPNVMKGLYNVDSYSFHNGTETFYNRNKYLVDAVGFQDFISAQDMDIEDIYFGNLDSEMIAACKEEMFPTDRRFNTYITSITMHGQYAHRDNLQPYYDILDQHGLLPLQEDENANAFRYYAAAAMDFDKALGEMLDYLEETGLMENTLIVLFADHNAYYQAISNYVKDIYPQSDPTEMSQLYRIPCFVRVGDQKERVMVDKFTCTADILPTILHLLGIQYYTNLCYGTDIFSPEESVLYSRAYDVFMTDRMYFTTLNNILWYHPDNDQTYLDSVARRAAILMEKNTYVNRIFAADFFAGEEGETFLNNLRQLNQD